MDIKENFADRLKESIKDKWPNLTQTEYAPKMGVAQGTVSEWVTAKKMPGLEKLIEIAIVLGVSIEWLATGRGNKHVQTTKRQPQVRLTSDQVNALKKLLDDLCE